MKVVSRAGKVFLVFCISCAVFGGWILNKWKKFRYTFVGFFFKKKKQLIRRTSLIPPSSMRLFFSPVDSNSHGKAGALLRQPWPRTLYCRESERPVSLIPFRLSSVTAVKASSRSRVHLFFFKKKIGSQFRFSSDPLKNIQAEELHIYWSLTSPILLWRNFFGESHDD